MKVQLVDGGQAGVAHAGGGTGIGTVAAMLAVNALPVMLAVPGVDVLKAAAVAETGNGIGGERCSCDGQGCRRCKCRRHRCWRAALPEMSQLLTVERDPKLSKPPP